MNVQNILVPIDYSADSQQALHWGVSLAGKYGAKLLLLHVIPKAVEEVYPEGTGWLSPTPSYYDLTFAQNSGGPKPIK
jgi:nucleotide-binding universal stress UspA family protein